MSDKTKIEWSDATWNPVTGCTKVSEGCRHCYAATFAERWRGTPGHYFENGFDLTLRPDKLDQPLRWTKPRKIFVNSMSDLFHKDIPDEFIRKVWEVMVACPRHTFQVLTKRPERMREWVSVHGVEISGGKPASNIWLGTSVENQKAADERIPLLLQTPAAIRFLSCEPLLGSVNLNQIKVPNDKREFHLSALQEQHDDCFYNAPSTIDWVITGGESGHGARPMHPDWARNLRDQCQAVGVAYFFKQWGEWAPEENYPDYIPSGTSYDFTNETVWKVGKKSAGRLLDGREWNEFPREKEIE